MKRECCDIDAGEVIIRVAHTGDLATLCGLLADLFAIEQDFSASRDRQRRGLELLLARHNSACVLAAERAGKVIGMCTAQILISTAEGGPVARVEDLVVDPAERGRGIGSRLLTALEQWARDHGLLRLQLLADRTNEPALRFYAREGWQATRLNAWHKHL